MKTRHVFVADSVPVATAAVNAARHAGIDAGDISLIASSDIEMDAVPTELRNAGTDFVPAALRGAAIGASVGLLCGLVGIAVPSIGLSMGGAIGITLIGVAIGTWITSLIGSMVPDAVHRRFESQIEAGRILIVVDETDALMGPADAALCAAGATQLPYETATALTR